MNTELYLKEHHAQALIEDQVIMLAIYETAQQVKKGDLVEAQFKLDTARRAVKVLESLQKRKNDYDYNGYKQVDLHAEQIRGSQTMNRQLEELIHAKGC